jgi:hypothetical protein
MAEAEVSTSIAIFLASPFCVDPTQLSDQNRVRAALLGLKGCNFIEVDGTIEKEYRNHLFNTSGHKGKYPQLFIRHSKENTHDNGKGAISFSNTNHEFIGLWSQVETLIEIDDTMQESSSVNTAPLIGLRETLKACIREREREGEIEKK